MPGIAKTLSVTTTPPIRSVSPTPMIVTIGIEAFRRAWLTTTVRVDRPLAWAVRT